MHVCWHIYQMCPYLAAFSLRLCSVPATTRFLPERLESWLLLMGWAGAHFSLDMTEGHLGPSSLNWTPSLRSQPGVAHNPHLFKQPDPNIWEFKLQKSPKREGKSLAPGNPSDTSMSPPTAYNSNENALYDFCRSLTYVIALHTVPELAPSQKRAPLESTYARGQD